MKIYRLLGIIAVASIISCGGNDEYVLPPKYVQKGPFDSGTLILNKGNTNQNASLSFLSFDLGAFKDNILSGTNSNIGLNATDLAFTGDLAYIVSSTDNKIEIVNRYTMAKIGTIAAGLTNPRNIAIANGKAFVTNLGNLSVATDDFVAVINLDSNTVTSSIAVNAYPDRILYNNGKIYISHNSETVAGSTISIINEITSAVASTTLNLNPNSMQVDGGFLWVMCAGDKNLATETTGALYKVSLTTNQFIESIQFPSRLTDPNNPNSAIIYQHPENLYVEGSTVFYTKGNSVYKMSTIPVVTPPATIAKVVIPTSATFSTSFSNISSIVAKNSYLYLSGYNSFLNNGTISVYSKGSQDLGATGTLLKTQIVGIAPAGFYFNQ